VTAGADLGEMIAGATPKGLVGGDILLIAHKVVSKAEGRTVALDGVEPGTQALAIAEKQERDPRLVQLILDETAELIREERGVLICRTHHGFVCANAGVDQSNADDGHAVLLPRDADASARALRNRIGELRGARPAVVISDSFGRAWRVGQVDVAIGAAGIAPLDDWRGRSDSRGRELTATQIAVADSLAAAADLARLKDASLPVVLARGLERFVTPDDGPGAAALRRPPAEDLFG
jgi:coenzyme F420-0:L-glutamate ligase/coenzyme F420-1:gamma-L-glutamate ligase